MAFVAGRLGYLKLGTTDVSAYVDNIDFTHDVNVVETTTMGKSYVTRAAALKNSSFSVGGVYDTTETTGLQAVLGPMLGTAVAFEYGPEGNATGKVKYSGTGVVASFNISQPVGDMVRWSAEIQGSDAVTIGTFTA